ncbi:outer membrane protein OprM [Rubritalea halochordaticola]|uniref:Outer membrane protein OprM n=1 Tax=Rubritalea halochordaticola TaxID=714537 RepID=A0ABP9UX64_9BACT
MLRVLTISSLSVALTACSGLIKTKSQDSASIKTPGNWHAVSKGQHGKISTGWLSDFDSPEMKKFVHEAVSNNPSLNASAARLRATREGTIGAYADLLPRVSASSSGSRSRSPDEPGPSVTSSSYNLSLNASWEPDIWGRLRDLQQANYAGYLASVEDYRAARLSLAANTAKAWCNLISAESQLELARVTLASFQKNNSIVERNYKAGVPGTRALAVQLSRNNVASAQRSVSSRLQDRNQAARQLEQLVGRYPAGLVKGAKELPRMKENIPSDIPASLLLRRPDLAAAQYQVFQSAKIADASQKNLLPSISLTSRASTSSRRFGDIFNPQYIASSVAASLAQTVYQGGELKANARAALDRNRASIHDFSTRAIAAFREVEDALEAERSLKEQEEFLLVEVKQATLAERSAELDYSEGVDDSGILEILESQRRANNARASLIALRNRRIQNRIDLHLALGGDFHTESK